MENKTKHATDCQRVFNRYDMACPRCMELAGGAAPRKGWYSRAADDARRCVEIDGHFKSERHTSGGCGVVCTFGEW